MTGPVASHAPGITNAEYHNGFFKFATFIHQKFHKITLKFSFYPRHGLRSIFRTSFIAFSHLICNQFSRKVVLQTRIFFLVNHFSQTRKKIRVCRTTFLQPEKMWIYCIKPPLFLVNPFSWTRFLKPDF